MFAYLPISYLNDYVFCPYSIYLHNVYKGGLEDNYHATPQIDGRNVHKSVDNLNDKTAKSQDIIGLEVYSEELGLMGKIDLFRGRDKALIERKNKLSHIYQGQIWQLQAQYFCMLEMEFIIKSLSFHSISDNKVHALESPSKSDKEILQETLLKIRDITTFDNLTINPNKCAHCIYNNLCDKTKTPNIY